jgi:hypothetical protein
MATQQTNPPAQVGDRIRLDCMAPGDPCPIPDGSTGTVQYATHIGGGHWQLRIKWDGMTRTLMLLYPEDRFTIIGKE